MTKGLKIAGIALIVGVGTYLGLELLLPHHKTEVTLEGLVPAESVFGDKLKSPEEVAAAAQTPGTGEANAEVTTPSGPAVNTDDATAAASETATAAPAAEAPAPSEPAQAAAPSEPTPPPAPAAEAAPVEKPVVAEKPAAKPAAKPATKTETAAAPAPGKKPAAKRDVSASPWWQSSTGNGLRVVYVGSAAYKRAIVIMGNAPFGDAASAGKNIRVTDAAGKRVSGKWELGASNQAMLILPVAQAGRYQVAIDAALSDTQSRKLGTALKGGVQVQ
jgi:type IV secretory pathway VirB10-like protein